MTLEEFTKRLIGRAGDFRVRTERAMARHPGIYADDQPAALWWKAFRAFVETKSGDTTRVRRR